MYICQLCKKNPATIHLTDIHNNVKKEVHICESCASEKGFNLQGAANLPQLLGLAAKKNVPPPPQAAQMKARTTEDDLNCPACGTTWSQFNERGRFGCPGDYKAFDARLRPIIANQIASHAATREAFHVGKAPGPKKGGDELGSAIRAVEKKLRQAVAEENYESAARLKAELDAMRRGQMAAKPRS